MLERFEGAEGRRRLIDTLRRQEIVQGNDSIAELLAEKLSLHYIGAGNVLIEQGSETTDLFFILIGRVSVLVHDRVIATRRSGQHVGELALIDPTAKRSASIVADEDLVIGRISEVEFSQVADEFPQLWRMIALEIASRLRQRNDLVQPRNLVPILFIGSSVESIAIAQAIQAGLAHDDVIVRVWTDSIFRPSYFTIEDLEEQILTSDFAVLILGPDDEILSRGNHTDAPRDNIIFELGLFMGSLGHRRTIIVYPRSIEIKIPTDILGLNPITYKSSPRSELASFIAPVCHEIRQLINSMGPR